MYDSYNRKITYLRISVTDRCNLRCCYCMPDDGISLLPHQDILSFEEIESFVKVAVLMGIDKVRITGGEPLVRKNVTELVRRIAVIDGVKEVGLTTNAVLLSQYAEMLKVVGLKRINISLDTIDPVKYAEITRGGKIEKVFAGIEKAKEIGFTPIKINCVVNRSAEEQNAVEVAQYCKEKDLQIRYIRRMTLHEGDFSIVKGGDGGNCKICNRLRLTANGKLKPCLFNDREYDIRKIGFEQAIKMAIENKPERGTVNHHNEFNNIGG